MTGHGRRSKERNEWREELEAEHRPKQVQRRLTERRRQSYLGDAILLPLVPFLIPNLAADTRFVASAVAAGIAFFAVGAAKGIVLNRPILRAGVETLLMGGGAAFLAYLVGSWLRAAFGVS